MGVRLVVNGKIYNESSGGGQGEGGYGTLEHDKLENRDLLDQHPISSITGLKSVLNNIETNILESLNKILKNKQDIERLVELYNQLAEDEINVIDTQTLDLNMTNGVINGNVKLFQPLDNSNAIITHPEGGLYSPKMILGNSNSIYWGSITNGESQTNLKNNGTRFCFDSRYNIYEDSVILYNGKLICTQSRVSYTGYISQYYYGDYDLSVDLEGIYYDQYGNKPIGNTGIVIGAAYDNTGKLHTLSLIVGVETSGSYYGHRFSLIYDFCNNTERQIWQRNYLNTPNSFEHPISILIKKRGKHYDIYTSRFKERIEVDNVSSIDTSLYTFHESIDLDAYNLSLFSGNVKYGYGFNSSRYCIVTNEHFYSENMQSDSTKIPNIKVSSTTNNGLLVKDDGIYVEKVNISSEPNNILIKKEDGYYVEKSTITLSEDETNGLSKSQDNKYYVHKSHSYIDVNQEEHGFIVGNFIYYDGNDNLYKKAIAENNEKINVIGMVSKVTDLDNFQIICNGFVETDKFENGYIQGFPLYLSNETPGLVTNIQPNISKSVGYTVKNGIVISIERGIEYHEEAVIGDFKQSANNYNVRSDGFIKIVENYEYKQVIASKLLASLSEEFLNNYIDINDTNGTFTFKNTNELYRNQNVVNELNLFIKAF